MNFTFAPDFTYRYFDSILNVIKKSFEVRLIGEGLNETTTRPQLFLRHDVDVSLKSALKLAEVEYQHEVRATYMVIPDSRLYNLHSYDTRRALDLLRNMDLKSKLMSHHPARVYEVAFWDPGKNGVHRTGSWPSLSEIHRCEISVHDVVTPGTYRAYLHRRH